jgi:hypothetical protein
VNALTRFLLNFFLVKNLVPFVRNRFTQIRERLSKIKPFSWEATLLLSLFSWFVFLLVQGEWVKHLVSIFAWGFLIIGTDWALMGQKVTIPLIGYSFQYVPWLTGAMACAALFSNDFIIRDWRSALTSYPIFAAGFMGYTKFIQNGLKWQLPDPGGRQDLVLSFLFCGLLSCWFQFHFLVQDIVQQYPNMLADEFDGSLFVTRLNPLRRPTTKAYALLDAAELTVRRELAGKTWVDAEAWLRNVDSVEAALSNQVIDQVYGEQLPREKQLWQITADPTFNPASNPTSVDLALRAKWLGASSRLDGYTFRRTCSIRQAAAPPPQTFEDMQTQQQTGGSYEFVCQQTAEEGAATPTPAQTPAATPTPAQTPAPTPAPTPPV